MEKLDNFPYKHIFYESDLPAAQKVVEFFEEYEQKKATHSATSLKGLSEKKLEELLYLDLGEKYWKEIPTQLYDCKSLQFLSIRYISKEESLDMVFLENLTQLKTLFIYIKSPNVYPEEIESFFSLVTGLKNLLILQIVFDNNYFKHGSIYDFKIEDNELVFLSCNGCGIDKVDFSSNSYPNMLVLDFSNNGITEIPKSIEQFINLEVLEIVGNIINEIPEEIGYLKKLKILYLNNFEDEFQNSIAYLPESIGNLSELEELDLGENLILKSLPKSIEKCKKIKFLNLQGNAFTSLPQEIGNLTELTVLDLRHNQITHLPPEIGNLTKLTELLLDGNPIQSFPPSLANLRKLKRIYAEGNNFPLQEMPEARGLGFVELFDFLNSKRGIGAYTTVWEVSKPLQTAFQQYLNAFTDFVARLHGKEIFFEVSKVPQGLQLSTQTQEGLSIEDIDAYLARYINIFLKQDADNLLHELSVVGRQQTFELKQLVHDLKFENLTLLNKIQNQVDKILFLGESVEEKKEQIRELQTRIRFFESHTAQLVEIIENSSLATSVKIDIQVTEEDTSEVDSDALLKDMIDKAIRMQERKNMESIEDLYTNDFTQWLRDKYHYVTDQTHSGKANITYGRLDIMIRKENGTPISIVEALKLSSCGAENTIVSSHIDKLLHDYDTAGNKRNFVLVYAQASKFDKLWANYVEYMKDLNHKKDFRPVHKLINFEDVSYKYSQKTDLKVGLATHEREGQPIEVFHLFINMSS